jgi:hypothetical protein
MIGREDLIEIVGGKLVDHDKHGFSRGIEFTASGVTYLIEWWKNVGHLKLSDNRYSLKIPFDSVSKDTCWPSYRNGFVFSKEDVDVAYVAVEMLEWQVKRMTAQPNLKENER